MVSSDLSVDLSTSVHRVHYGFSIFVDAALQLTPLHQAQRLQAFCWFPDFHCLQLPEVTCHLIPPSCKVSAFWHLCPRGDRSNLFNGLCHRQCACKGFHKEIHLRNTESVCPLLKSQNTHWKALRRSGLRKNLMKLRILPLPHAIPSANQGL